MQGQTRLILHWQQRAWCVAHDGLWPSGFVPSTVRDHSEGTLSILWSQVGAPVSNSTP